MGFEPTEPFGSPVFKTGAIDHSTTPPVRCCGRGMHALQAIFKENPQMKERIFDTAAKIDGAAGRN